MNATKAVAALGALAHHFRLAIYRLLVEKGAEGLPAGVIADRIGLVPSSLTFHVQALQRSGLISQRRVSRQLFYAADFAAMNDLVAYLTENCCGDACAPACKPAPATRTARRAQRKIA